MELDRKYLLKQRVAEQSIRREANKLFNEGKVQFSGKNYELARDLFQEALKIYPKHMFAADYLKLTMSIINYNQSNEKMRLDLLKMK